MGYVGTARVFTIPGRAAPRVRAWLVVFRVTEGPHAGALVLGYIETPQARDRLPTRSSAWRAWLEVASGRALSPATWRALRRGRVPIGQLLGNVRGGGGCGPYCRAPRRRHRLNRGRSLHGRGPPPRARGGLASVVCTGSDFGMTQTHATGNRRRTTHSGGGKARPCKDFGRRPWGHPRRRTHPPLPGAGRPPFRWTTSPSRGPRGTPSLPRARLGRRPPTLRRAMQATRRLSV